jgi:hypothetical protein
MSRQRLNHDGTQFKHRPHPPKSSCYYMLLKTLWNAYAFLCRSMYSYPHSIPLLCAVLPRFCLNSCHFPECFHITPENARNNEAKRE